MLHVRLPAAPLDSLVERLWYCDGYPAAHRRERVLPNGRFQLVIDLAAPAQSAPALVIGMQSRHTVLETAALQAVAGVVFRPGGARPFFDAPADDFQNQSVALDLVWGRAAGELRDRLRAAPTPAMKLAALEAALAGRANPRFRSHPAVQYGLIQFHRAPRIRSVLELARETGLSRRWFAQLFREQVGVTPKLYCRIRRFRQVVNQIGCGAPVNWAGVAAAGGYSDQAHLGHEFLEFAGISPAACLAAERPFVNHVAID